MKKFSSILTFCFLLATVQAQKFYPDDPVWEDPDRNPIPMPTPRDLSQIYDFVENTFVCRGENAPVSQNVNTLGEVPNSSWFTNRIGVHPMTIEELVRGPNQGTGPDDSQPWVIVRAKSEGISPGFTIRDSRGDIYFIKFDPMGNPQLATSTEVICTKFFHAFGYHVPENYLTLLNPHNLKVAPDASITDDDGTKRGMRGEDVERILKRVPRRSDGKIQVIASRGLAGKDIGHFKYYGTRKDDKNDIFPHEDRRELRGLRIFAAWLNHDDTRSINSLDMYVKEGEAGYVKHHLIDFGSCLGSGSVKVQTRRAGNEYILEWGAIGKAAASVGLWDRRWRHVKYPDYPAVGRFEGDFFHPARWKPEYPNPAFDRMQTDDAFWAVKIVSKFTDAMVRAIVRTGQFTDPKAEGYLAGTIIKRRDKIIQHYLAQLNPLDDFRPSVDGSRLDFKNVGSELKVGSATGYEYEWFRFDNQQIAPEPIGRVQSTPAPSLAVPKETADFLMVRIRTLGGHPAWTKKVEVYIRNGATPSVVGIDRER